MGGRKCCVPNCKSNYDSVPGYVSVFRFPKDQQQKNLWLKKIPRADFVPSKEAVVCAKHFNVDDIITHDTLPTKTGNISILRGTPKLKEHAYPSIFPGCPAYLTETRRYKRVCTVERQAKMRRLDDKDFECFLEQDKITFNDLIEGLLTTKAYLINSNSISMHSYENCVALMFISCDKIPKVLKSLAIDKNLHLIVHNGDKIVKPVKFNSNLLIKEKLSSWSELENMLRFVSSLSENDLVEDKSNHVKEAISYLKLHLEEINVEEGCYTSMHFLLEQLEIMCCSRIRYSSFLTVFAYTIYMSSPSCYEQLRHSKLLLLPSSRRLRQIACGLSVNPGINNSSNKLFLKNMCINLEPHERLTNLLIDEIHIKNSISYKAKSLSGFSVTNPGEQPTNILAFMVVSVFSKHKEITSLVPVNKLTAEDMYNLTLQTIELIEESGLNLLSIITDNNRINGKMFLKLSNSEDYKSCVPNPINPSKSIFLLFDTVHLIKSIRNNWISQIDSDTTFIFPCPDNSGLTRKASFSHLVKIYYAERNNVIKLSPKLTFRSLFPSSIEKQNVLLALKVFDDTNIAAMQMHPESVQFNDTCFFLKLISRWWNMVNIKHPRKGLRLNQPDSHVFKSLDDERLQFLNKFSEWVKDWGSKNLGPSKGGLTSDTCKALSHTTATLILIIKHLLNVVKASYVLTGKFQTDSLEARFGQYRQLSGANYHVSAEQILESEKKIRFKNVLTFFSSKAISIPLKDFVASFQTVKQQSSDLLLFIDVLGEDVNLDSLNENDLNVLAYIGGYCVFKLNIRCSMCEFFLLTENMMFIDDADVNTVKYFKYMDLISRGKLKKPSQDLLTIISVAYLVMTKIMNGVWKTDFLSIQNQHTVLVDLSLLHLENVNLDIPASCCECQCELSDVKQKILNTFVNVLLNNFTKNVNDKCASHKSNTRKLSKFKNI